MEGKPGILKILYQSRDFLDDFSFYKKSILLTNFAKSYHPYQGRWQEIK